MINDGRIYIFTELSLKGALNIFHTPSIVQTLKFQRIGLQRIDLFFYRPVSTLSDYVHINTFQRHFVQYSVKSRSWSDEVLALPWYTLQDKHSASRPLCAIVKHLFCQNSSRELTCRLQLLIFLESVRCEITNLF